MPIYRTQWTTGLYRTFMLKPTHSILNICSYFLHKSNLFSVWSFSVNDNSILSDSQVQQLESSFLSTFLYFHISRPYGNSPICIFKINLSSSHWAPSLMSLCSAPNYQVPWPCPLPRWKFLHLLPCSWYILVLFIQLVYYLPLSRYPINYCFHKS